MKLMVSYGSRIWLKLLKRANPGMIPLGVHDGFVVVRYRGRIWKIIAGGPEAPVFREVYRHDFTRPA